MILERNGNKWKLTAGKDFHHETRISKADAIEFRKRCEKFFKGVLLGNPEQCWDTKLHTYMLMLAEGKCYIHINKRPYGDWDDDEIVTRISLHEMFEFLIGVK